MEIKQFVASQTNELISLWNKNVVPYSIYAPLTLDSFQRKFTHNPNFDEGGLLVAVIANRIVGFGHAIYKRNAEGLALDPGFVTCVVVDKEYWRQGIGTRLLKALETFLRTRGINYVRNLFLNPTQLEWHVPGYDFHEHPNAPAVPFNSPYYFLLLANGYIVDGQEDAYHINLKTYELPNAVIKTIRANEAKGLNITIYEKGKHYGFDALFDALNNEGWRQQISDNLKVKNPNPILIAESEGEILGFTGPLYKQPSGRANLFGLAVHPKAQRRGLGKSLFSMLCEESRKMGATFMTLHTGAKNPAREIYLYAGMQIVQSFAILRKEL